MDRFLIAPADGGLQNDLKPFAIPDSAFARLNNAYVFRGRVRKRFGTRMMGDTQKLTRFRVALTLAAGTTYNLPAGANQLAVGQMFSTDNALFYVDTVGGAAVPTLSTNSAVITATINDTVNPNQITFTGAVVGTVWWYPARPVMGLISYQASDINFEPVFGFDTQFAYQYTTGWQRLGTETWSGSDSQFFWGTTWTGTNASERLLFVVNNNQPDLIKYWTGAAWNNLNPELINTGASITYLETARIMVTFKNRLVAFNVVERTDANPPIRYTNRARWCQIGDPRDAANSWRQDLPNRGGGLDAPTMEQIITVEFIKDRLIVYFEGSTWEFISTGNDIEPFAWQQINTELGAESTFSVVPFDKVALGVGAVGIHACNGINTERIDDKIPQEVFNINNIAEGVERIYGIRDYETEQVYWTFPDVNCNAIFPYPNRILVFNYKTGTWALFDDSFTAFGYYQPSDAITWDSDTVSWDSDTSWDSGSIAARNRKILAGNQEGWVLIAVPEETRNAPSLQVNAFTSIDLQTVRVDCIAHNLRIGDFILFEDIIWDDASTVFNDSIYQVSFADDPNYFYFTRSVTEVITGIYEGGGTIARVSRVDILTKQYNFYAKQGRNLLVSKVDFLFDRADGSAAVGIDYFNTTSITPLVQGATTTGSLLGDGTLSLTPYALYPAEANQAQLWRTAYLQSDGAFIQLRIYYTDEQMATPLAAFQPFQMHQMMFHAQPTALRFQ